MKYETKDMLRRIIPLILFTAFLMGSFILLDQYQSKIYTQACNSIGYDYHEAINQMDYCSNDKINWHLVQLNCDVIIPFYNSHCITTKINLHSYQG